MMLPTWERKGCRLGFGVLVCLWMVPAIAFAQETSKKPAKPAPAPAPQQPAKTVPRPAQPQNVRPAPQSPPIQPQKGRGPGVIADPPRRPPFSPPSGTNRVPRPDGSATITHADGRKWEVGSTGQVTRFSKQGMEARFGNDGRPTFVRDDKRGVTITRNPKGVREVVSSRPGGIRVVSYGMNRGYVERSIPGRPGYVQRTYVMGGRQYATVSRTYSYRGIVYQRYVSAVYYQPRFYAWAATPWPAAVAYSWGWNADPWYGYYAGYFVPAPAYPNAALWLTDFLLAENLRLNYENLQQGGDAPPPLDAPTARISPAVKLAIAEEVRQQIAAEQQLSAQSTAPSSPTNGPAPVALPPALDPAQKVFVISSNLDVPTGGATCPLGPGDIIVRTDDQIGVGNTVAVTVLNSMAGHCPMNSMTAIDVATLQDMHNAFANQMDAGLGKLASNQGSGGLPSGPPAGAFNSRDGQAQPDLNLEASLIQQTQQAANQSEMEARLASNPGGQ